MYKTKMKHFRSGNLLLNGVDFNIMLMVVTVVK